MSPTAFSSSRLIKWMIAICLSVIACLVPMSAASSAHAATGGSVWDRVAACESSGNWHANTGNGFYGGLQFTQSTWDSFGGGAYAPRADLATPQQQVTVAEKVLAVQGPHAWPVCSIVAGLDQANGMSSAPAPAQNTAQVSAQANHQPNAPAAQPTQQSTHTSSHIYVVQPGDNLSSIAAHFHISGSWHTIYAHNHSVIGSNPNLIFPGQHLNLG